MTPLLRVREAAEVLAVSSGTVHRLVRNGELRSVRVGARLRFTEAELARLVGLNDDGDEEATG